jgi:SAM-dependent methyltransferase
MNREEIICHALNFQWGGMSPEELAAVYDLCVDKKVLELGSMVGMSSYVIASVGKELSCVDAWSDTQEFLAHDPLQAQVYRDNYPEIVNVFERFNKNCKEFIDSGKIKMYRGLTQELADNFADSSFDIVLIDADHSYVGVARDFEFYHKKVKPDGYLVFHDYGCSTWTGVSILCHEMIAKGKMIGVKRCERIAVFQVC